MAKKWDKRRFIQVVVLKLYSIVFYCFQLYSIVFNCIQLFSIVFNCIQLFSIVFNCIQYVFKLYFQHDQTSATPAEKSSLGIRNQIK